MKLFSLLLGIPLALVGTRGVATTFNYAEALQKSIYFYEAQQSGALPDWNRVAWRGDSALQDGSDVGHDLTGGWYDAGDHVKFGFPMAATTTVLAWGVIENKEAYVRSGQWPAMKRNLRFVGDYLMKAHTAPNELWGQVGNGSKDHAWWGAAEVMPMERPSYKIDQSCPGSDLAGETASALAALSIVFAAEDPAYAAELLRHARELNQFAYDYQGKYSDCITDAQGYYNSWSGIQDELVWSALWLYKATGEASYLEQAKREYEHLSNEAQQDVKSYKWTHAWDDKSYGCYLLMAQITGESRYRQDVERWLDWWTVGFGDTKVEYTPGGLAYLNTWGPARYASNTAFLALIYSDYLRDVGAASERQARYYQFAVSQIQYLLGDNPLNMSYQIGFGDRYPLNPHHRTAHGSWTNNLTTPEQSRHLLVGALVGGPSRSDTHNDDRQDYILNEVATDYNAGFTSALARLYLDFGGEPLDAAAFPKEEERDLELYVEAKANSSGPRYIEIAALVHNHTAWPAVVTSDLKLRYFLELKHELSKGYRLDELEVRTAYSQASQVMPLKAWGNPEAGLYYVEVSFAGIDIFPGGQSESRKEVQFRIALPSHTDRPEWSNAEDPSWDDYGNAFQLAPKIALYRGEQLVWGREP